MATKYQITVNRMVQAPTKCANGAYRLSFRAKLVEPITVKVQDGERVLTHLLFTLFTAAKIDPAKVAGKGFDVEASRAEGFRDYRVTSLIRNKKLDGDDDFGSQGEPTVKLD